MRVRDPWGICKWKGEWRTKDPKWKKITTPRFNSSLAKHGSFFIEFEEFYKCFNSFKICYYTDNYKYSALKIENLPPNQLTMLEIDIPLPGQYYFSCNQINRRHYKFVDDYSYSSIFMILTRIWKNGKISYVRGKFKDYKEIWMRNNCPKAKYFLFIQPNWKNFIRQFAFSIYGPEVCNIKEVKI